MDGVGGENACRRAGVLYIAGRVVKHYSGPGCDAGQYAFSSAGKACKKVGLNKTLCQQKIRVKSQLIQLDSVSAGAGADKGKGALIAVCLLYTSDAADE